MITILSDNGWFRADLKDGEDGIVVTIWRRVRCDGAQMWRISHRETLDTVFHVACDLVHDQLQTLEPEFDSTPPAEMRRRVVSIVR
jgi:hypothetical protein